MANLFEKPVAANPISTYAKLPLQFMAQLNSQRQSQELRNIQMIGQVDNTLTTHKALGRDLPKQQEILKGYEDRIEALSQVESLHDSAKGLTKLKAEIAGNKELQAYNSTYKQGMSDRANLQKRFEDQKIGKGQYSAGLKNLAGHETTQDEFGNYSGYSPYSGSNIYDVRSELTKIVKGTHEKFDGMGQGFKDKGQLRGSLNSAIQSNPQFEQAIRENFEQEYRPTKTDPKEESRSKYNAYKGYRENLLNSVATDEAFQKVDDQMASSGYGVGTKMVYNNFGNNKDGKLSSYKGGSMATLKSIVMNMTGKDGGRQEFDDFANSEEGKFDIKYLEQRSNTKMPKDYLGAVEWVEKYSDNTSTTSVIGHGVSQAVALGTINKQGFFTDYTDIRDQNGNKLSKEEVMQKVEGAQRNSKGQVQRVAKVLHRIKGGTLSGRLIIQGADGNKYTKEPKDTGITKSFQYNHEKIMGVKAGSYNGRKNVTLPSSITSGRLVIPAGDYQVRHYPSVKSQYEEGKSSVDQVILFQNGKKMYATDGVEYRKLF